MMDKDKNPGEKVTFRIAEAQGGKRNRGQACWSRLIKDNHLITKPYFGGLRV